MKISKSLLKTIAVAVVIGTTQTACVKDSLQTTDENGQTIEKPLKRSSDPGYNCPGCGMG